MLVHFFYVMSGFDEKNLNSTIHLEKSLKKNCLEIKKEKLFSLPPPSFRPCGPATRAPPFSFLGLAQPAPLPSPLFSLAADGWGPPVRTTPYLQPPRPRVSLGWKLPRPKLPRPRSPPSPALRSLEEPPRASRLTSPHFPLSPLGLLPIASAQKTVAGVLRPPREASFQSRFRSDLAPW